MATRTLTTNLEWRQGDDYDYEFYLLDSETIPQPTNFNASVLEFMVKSNYTDGDSSALIFKEIEFGIELNTLTYKKSLYSNSQAIISISNAETEPLTVGSTYYFDLVYSPESGGKRYTVINGTIKILPQVNKNN